MRPPAAPDPGGPPDQRPARSVNGYVLMAFAAAIGSGPPPNFARSLPFVELARAACRDPEPGRAGPAVQRIDEP